MTKTLPSRDISPLAPPDIGLGRAVATALDDACRGPGFFLAMNHGVATVPVLFDAARAVFALPEAAKQAPSIRRSPHNRGHVALAQERLDPSKPADRKEAFTIGRDLPPDHPEVLAGAPFRGVNLWPERPGFRQTTLAHVVACRRLGMLLHRATV
jgi:isopenicillin N synthase-like dioxygenase